MVVAVGCQGDWVDDERCGEGEFTYNTGDVYRGRWSEDRQSEPLTLQTHFTHTSLERSYKELLNEPFTIEIGCSLAQVMGSQKQLCLPYCYYF